MVSINYKIQEHCFGQSHTIEAVIKLYHNYALTDEELKAAVDIFNELNDYEVPKVGQTMQIPVYGAK